MHVSTFRVYYEDTDMAGIVYYANYLRFFERGRSDAVRAMGIDQIAMREAGLVFAVVRVEIDYRSPARFGDLLRIETRTDEVGGATLAMAQRALVGDRLAAEGVVRVACMSLAGRIARFPADIRAALGRSATI